VQDLVNCASADPVEYRGDNRSVDVVEAEGEDIAVAFSGGRR